MQGSRITLDAKRLGNRTFWDGVGGVILFA